MAALAPSPGIICLLVGLPLIPWDSWEQGMCPVCLSGYKVKLSDGQIGGASYMVREW